MKPTKLRYKNGKIAYVIQVRNKITGKREGKTFSTASLAREWADKRMKEIEHEAVHGKQQAITVMDAITAYEEQYKANIGRSKRLDLKRLKSYEISLIDVSALTARDIIKHIAERNKTVKPQTAHNDLVWLRTVLKTMSVTMGFYMDFNIFAQAGEVLRKERLIKASDKRNRTLAFREIIDLCKYFDGHFTIPMKDIFLFALFSCRRQEEITKLRWDDNNDAKQTGMVQDAKHPTKKVGNHKRFKYTTEAWRIAQRQPKTGEFIFPYNPKTIGSCFTKACKVLRIKDLHFHDCRHHAITRLVQKGYGIDQLRHFSLHDSYAVLGRYVNTKPEDI